MNDGRNENCRKNTMGNDGSVDIPLRNESLGVRGKRRKWGE